MIDVRIYFQGGCIQSLCQHSPTGNPTTSIFSPDFYPFDRSMIRLPSGYQASDFSNHQQLQVYFAMAKFQNGLTIFYEIRILCYKSVSQQTATTTPCLTVCCNLTIYIHSFRFTVLTVRRDFCPFLTKYQSPPLKSPLASGEGFFAVHHSGSGLLKFVYHLH